MNPTALRPVQNNSLSLQQQAQNISETYREDWCLVQRCMRGDRRSWVLLVERYENTIYYAVLHGFRGRGISISQEEVLDIQADIFAALVKKDFHKLSRYAGRSKLSRWLKVVASNHVIDLLRHRRPTVSFDDTSESAQYVTRSLCSREESPDDALGRQQLTERMRALYRELPQDDQRFVELFLVQELSFEEVAAAMNTTVGAIYARKNRVRKKLISLARTHQLL